MVGKLKHFYSIFRTMMCHVGGTLENNPNPPSTIFLNRIDCRCETGSEICVILHSSVQCASYSMNNCRSDKLAFTIWNAECLRMRPWKVAIKNPPMAPKTPKDKRFASQIKSRTWRVGKWKGTSTIFQDNLHICRTW